MFATRDSMWIELCSFLFFSTCCARAFAEDPAAAPRYHLTPGMELTYKGKSDFKYEGGAFHYKKETTAWVVRKNPDGSYRIVLRESMAMDREGDYKSQGKPDISLGYFDLFEDGRMGPNPELGYRIDPTDLFCKLPKDLTQAAGSWTQPASYDSSIKYKQNGNNGDGGFVMEAVHESRDDAVYLSARSSVIHFDPKQGLVRRLETKSAQGYGFVGKGTGEAELKSVEMRDEKFMKEFADASDRYFQASKQCEKLTERATKEPSETKNLLALAETTLTEARNAITQPMFRESLDHQLASHKQMTSYYEQQARDRAEVVGKPAAEWEAKDLAGRRHALKDYRGKVVLLDFWYRGCGWCMRAMPQIIQLADDFKDQPVAVLGMNTDQDEKDAQFVVDAMRLNYAVLKAQGIPEKYKVQGFPTLVIIDPNGKVADFHVGYSPTLRGDIGAIVKGLLPRP
jgi:thiol-disulfide isomerase/thioredoxin